MQEMLATLINTPDYDMHYTRWDMVRELRDRRVELALPRRLPDGTTASYAPTWEASYENAAEALGGTSYEGSSDTIKKSYQLIERLFRSGKRLLRNPQGKNLGR